MKSIDKGGDVQVIPMAKPDSDDPLLKKRIGCRLGRRALGHTMIRAGNGRRFSMKRDLWPQAQFIHTASDG